MEDKISKKTIVFVTISLTAFVSTVLSVLLIKFSPVGDGTREYNAMMFVFSAFLAFVNSLTCLTALLCLKPKIRQSSIYYNLSLYGLLIVFNILIIIVCFPNNDRYYRTREIIELITPLVIFIIGQTILGKLLKNQE